MDVRLCVGRGWPVGVGYCGGLMGDLLTEEGALGEGALDEEVVVGGDIVWVCDGLQALQV